MRIIVYAVPASKLSNVAVLDSASVIVCLVPDLSLISTVYSVTLPEVGASHVMMSELAVGVAARFAPVFGSVPRNNI